MKIIRSNWKNTNKSDLIKNLNQLKNNGEKYKYNMKQNA